MTLVPCCDCCRVCRRERERDIERNRDRVRCRWAYARDTEGARERANFSSNGNFHWNSNCSRDSCSQRRGGARQVDEGRWTAGKPKTPGREQRVRTTRYGTQNTSPVELYGQPLLDGSVLDGKSHLGGNRLQDKGMSGFLSASVRHPANSLDVILVGNQKDSKRLEVSPSIPMSTSSQ